MAGIIVYSIAKAYINSFYVDKEMQTDAWENYSEGPSQIIQTSPTSIGTNTPIFSPIENTDIASETIIENASTVTTILPIPPINIETVPNPDIVITLANKSAGYYDYLDRASAIADMVSGGYFF